MVREQSLKPTAREFLSGDPNWRLVGARLWSKTQPQRVGNMKPLSTCPAPPAFDLLRLVLRTAALHSKFRPPLSRSAFFLYQLLRAIQFNETR
jgi:hypothetical protein